MAHIPARLAHGAQAAAAAAVGMNTPPKRVSCPDVCPSSLDEPVGWRTKPNKKEINFPLHLILLQVKYATTLFAL